MIKTGVIVSNPFQENTIVLSDSTGECIIVDAGGYTPQENAALSKYIEQNGLRPVMAVNTHGHVDHMLGVNYVKDTYGVPFAIDGRDAFLIESAPTHGAIYGFRVDSVPGIDVDLQGQKEIRFGHTTMRIDRRLRRTRSQNPAQVDQPDDTPNFRGTPFRQPVLLRKILQAAHGPVPHAIQTVLRPRIDRDLPQAFPARCSRLVSEMPPAKRRPDEKKRRIAPPPCVRDTVSGQRLPRA